MVNRVQFYGQGPLQAMRQDARTNPRLQMAQAMMQQGSSIAPVQSWQEGLSRMLQSGVGGYFAGKEQEKLDKREKAYNEAMKQALMGAQAKPWVNPDTGQVSSAPAGGRAGFASAAMRSGNADIMPMALQAQLDAQSQQEEMRRQDELYKRQMADKEQMFNLQNKAAEMRAKEAQQSRLDFFKASQESQDRRLMEQRQFATETEQKKVDAKNAALERETDKTLGAFDEGMRAVSKAFGEATTGPVVGMFPTISEAGQDLNSSVASLAPLLKGLFRTAGEGTFTDKDQELLLAMVPNEKMDKGPAQNAINRIYSIVYQKMGRELKPEDIPKIKTEDGGLSPDEQKERDELRKRLGL